MPTRLIQLDDHPSGTAAFQIIGPTAAQILVPEEVEIAIIQPGPTERHLDPRNPDDAWTTSVYRFRPLNPRRDGAAVWLEIDYGVTYHLRARQPYKLVVRQFEGMEAEEIFTGPATLRRPSQKPAGWTPPPDPRGPVSVPETPAPQPPPPPLPPPPPAPEPPAPATAPAPPAAAAAPVENRETTEPPPPPPPLHDPIVDGQPRNTTEPRKPWPLVAGLALLLAAGAGYWWWQQPPTPAPAVPPGASAASAASPGEPMTLAQVQVLLAGNPDVAAARQAADELAKAGRLLDGQFLLYRYAAGKGDAEAARIVGSYYDPDTWTKDTSPMPAPNPVEATRWLKQGAEAGDAEAQYRYAMLLKQGRTEESNGPEQAVGWLQKAAGQGHEAARKAIASP